MMGAIDCLHPFPAAQQISAPVRPRYELLRSSQPQTLLCAATVRMFLSVHVQRFPCLARIRLLRSGCSHAQSKMLHNKAAMESFSRSSMPRGVAGGASWAKPSCTSFLFTQRQARSSAASTSTSSATSASLTVHGRPAQRALPPCSPRLSFAFGSVTTPA